MVVSTLSGSIAFSTPFLSTIIDLFIMSRLMVVETSSGSKGPPTYFTGVVSFVVARSHRYDQKHRSDRVNVQSVSLNGDQPNLQTPHVFPGYNYVRMKYRIYFFFLSHNIMYAGTFLKLATSHVSS